ncbi:glycosyltransferase family 4 protein [Roseovarius sp. 2305UL8-3]|uniref:glycosyltransferase family 4 protein n=1 Tax=Roseovarius conchicola TaxID=3121636 RepID=UPI0035298D8A
MSISDRNAVIWYADDGYDPENKGLNGRRVAGASFLNGFFCHANVDEFVSLTKGSKSEAAFAKRLSQSGRDLPHRAVYTDAPGGMAPVGTLYYPSPNYAEQCWLRQRFGMNAWSICGITHTTATTAVMQGMFDLRAGPQAEWDAVICTSKAVHAATSYNMDLAERHLRERFGKVPPRPQMPVIPLGIDCDAFAPDEKAGSALRRRMGWGEKDIVVATLSRLVPYGKFDPGPLFLALQQAQSQLPKGTRLHMLACGIYGDTHSERVFDGCARTLMPDVSYLHLDGMDATARKETLSGADIFTFPIDNIQETFGLAPIEAMAAGLPVVTTDWDGMRDTISDEVGIRVPTTTVSGTHTGLESWRYQVGRQSYAQYGNNASAMTAADMPTMIRAFVDLATNPDLRARMGADGRARARTLYDWSVVIPQMQDLWAELSDIRAAAGVDKRRGPVPMAPSPMSLFRAYPTQQIKPAQGRFYATDNALDMEALYDARRFETLKQFFEPANRVTKVLEALRAAGPGGADADTLSAICNLPAIRVERACVFLMKYGLARHEDVTA